MSGKTRQEIMKIIDDFSEDTRQVLKDNLVAQYLFGSHARGEATEESDIDILIVVKQYDHH